jgi:hypothetical protein
MPKGTHLLPRDLAKLNYEAGWTDANQLLISIAVEIAEGNGYVTATHVNPDGSIDRGLWQINDKAHPDVTDADAFDPVKATAWARKIYVDRGHTFNAWSAYMNGAWRGPQALGYAFDGVANYLRIKHNYPIG